MSGKFLKLLISRTFQDQTHCPGLSRSWKFQEKQSRTFREAWEPWEKRTYILLCV